MGDRLLLQELPQGLQGLRAGLRVAGPLGYLPSVFGSGCACSSRAWFFHYSQGWSSLAASSLPFIYSIAWRSHHFQRRCCWCCLPVSMRQCHSSFLQSQQPGPSPLLLIPLLLCTVSAPQ